MVPGGAEARKVERQGVRKSNTPPGARMERLPSATKPSAAFPGDWSAAPAWHTRCFANRQGHLYSPEHGCDGDGDDRSETGGATRPHGPWLAREQPHVLVRRLP